jgi:hypothetical protein
MSDNVIDFTGAWAAQQLDTPLSFDEAIAGLKYAAKHGRCPTLQGRDGRYWLTGHPVSVFDDPPLM